MSNYRFQSARLLLQAGAHPGGGIEGGELPLALAIAAYADGDATFALVDLFVQSGAALNVSADTHLSDTPLFQAFHHFEDSKDRRVFDLIASRAELNPDGKSLLVDAIKGPLLVEDVASLITFGVDVNARGVGRDRVEGRMIVHLNETPLVAAATLEDHDRAKAISQHLISAGADVNKPGSYGGSAMHVALLSENFGLVVMLYEQGAEAGHRNKSGETPLESYMSSLDGAAPPAHVVPMLDALRIAQEITVSR